LRRFQLFLEQVVVYAVYDVYCNFMARCDIRQEDNNKSSHNTITNNEKPDSFHYPFEGCKYDSITISRRMIMNLQEQMDTFKKGFVEQVPEQALEIMARSGEQLQNSGIADQAMKVGDKAPDFSLSNTSERDVSLRVLLERGPVVLSFFRGAW
jgi:hypothetical protein